VHTLAVDRRPFKRRLSPERRHRYAAVMNEAAIAIEGLEKVYDNGKRALHGVTLNVDRGLIFGLLGPNGAGKSTIINILSGMVRKTAGSASIWGFDIDRHPRNAHVSIGIVPQEILFDPFFTPFETLDIQAGLYGVAKARRRTAELLRAVHLEAQARAYSRTLSGGMKRRLMVAKAMVHSPPVLVLDEPTAGVDVELRQQLWAYVRANESTRALVGMAQEKAVEVTVDRDLAEPPSASCFDKATLIGPRTVAITYSKDRVNAGEVLAALQSAGLGIVDVSTREADLEDVFLKLTSGTVDG
jgi:ABC-2 type transport system ATP-binding protein